MRGERAIERGLLGLTLVGVGMTLAILVFMLVLAFPLVREGHFPDLLVQPWAPRAGSYGVLPMLAGTVAIAILGTLFAFPVSLGVGGLMSGLAPGFLQPWLRRLVRLMTGIPTVVYGFVGVFLLTPVLRRLFDHGSGLCVLGASVMLAVLVAPTMILFMADGFARVPKSYLDAADALGATPVQRFLFVVVPAGRGGIVTGGLLGLARAFGDTLIALMLAGNAAAVPHSPLDPARTLTSHIALVQAADVDSLEFRSIFVCGLVLYLLTTVLIMTVRRVGATSLGAP